jgi:NAD(P) transhydrogenase
MGNAASTLYSNNISKFLLHMTSKDKKFDINLEDPILRGAVITHNNEFLWPNPNPPMLDAKKAAPKKAAKKEEVPEDPKTVTLRTAVA